MISRRSFLLSSAASVFAADAEAQSPLSLNPSFAVPSGQPAYSSTTFTAAIDAGGYATGISIANDGTLLCRCDNPSPYLWDGTKWNQLLNATSMPVGFVGIGKAAGCYEAQIAPSNSNYIYMIWDGYFFYSSNQGGTFTQSATFSQVPASPTCPSVRFECLAPHIAVDPQNPLHVVVGVPSGAVFRTTDGGATFSTITGTIAAPGTPTGAGQGSMLVLFNPTGTVSGGFNQEIWVQSYGTGWYRSTNAGSTWTLTTGTPTAHFQAQFGQDGYLYTTPDTTLLAYVWNGSAWSSATIGSGISGPFGIAADPQNNGRVYAYNGGCYSISTNHASSWVGVHDLSQTFSAGDTPWLAGTATSDTSGGGIVFDPRVGYPNTVYISSGIGVWTANPNNASNTHGPALTAMSKGLGQLDPFQIVPVPGDAAIMCSWDRPFIRAAPVPGPGQLYLPNTGANLHLGSSVDFAPSPHQNFIVGIANAQAAGDASGYSSNGLQTWNSFGSTTPSGSGTGGVIVASSTSNLFWLGAANSIKGITAPMVDYHGLLVAVCLRQVGA